MPQQSQSRNQVTPHEAQNKTWEVITADIFQIIKHSNALQIVSANFQM